MIGGRFSNILEDEEVQESMQWCGYCMGIVAVFVVAAYVFFTAVLMIKN
jgi:hypothetical protein